jgi:putative acetyltransferase
MPESKNQLNMLIIREECADDYPAVFEINTRAFDTDLEARLVNLLRRKARPVVSLVAERDDKLIGHIMFSPVQIDEEAAGGRTMGLGPVAVHPDARGQGVGAKLVQAGLDACRALRTELVFVVGEPEYYSRFGFKPAADSGFHYKDENKFVDVFFVLELTKGAASGLSGEVRYHPAFDSV